tara:strand:+ start:226 stop:852 length:627 start_codon:yes stop_codon:yes gene_type:complete
MFLEHFDKLTALLMLISMSIGIRLLLQYFGQRWITTIAHTTTIVFLPILTYTITNVISGNIALSLGMVGALSIVRFRNPVRSPLELSVYFCAITMGIAASVSLLWLLFLNFSILIAVIILCLINILSKKLFHKSFFNASFTEGNNLSTLDVNALVRIKSLDSNKFLTLKKESKDSIQYVLASNYVEDLNKILVILEDDPNVINYEFRK